LCFFSVKAVNAAGSSEPSEEMSAVPRVPTIREFPDTTDKTLLLVDQIGGSSRILANEAQLEFIANNFVGTQIMTRTFNDRIRELNPDFIVLHYRLGIWQSAVPYIINGVSWGNDIDAVDSHEDWFMHKVGAERTKANRLVAFDDGKMLMNITNPEFYDYFLDTTVLQCQAGDYDGIFFDSSGSATLPYYIKIPDSGFEGDKPATSKYDELGGISWTQAATEFFTKLTRDLAEYGLKVLPNFDQLWTGWDDTDYSVTDGGMAENSLSIYQSWAVFEDWELSMNNLSRLAINDKIILFETFINSSDYNNRIFTLANYLLLRDKHTYLCVVPDGETGLHCLPELTLDVGSPLDFITEGINDLKDEESGLYIREFTKGLVLVNADNDVIIDYDTWEVLGPNEEVKTYEIPSSKHYKRLSVNGTGKVDENGQYDGEMMFEEVNGTLSIPPKSAVILVLTDDEGNGMNFNDVAADAWYKKAVDFIAARKITLGTGSGNFSPNAKLTRGEFIVLMMRAYGIAPDTDTADNFSDAGNTYYTGYLAAAKRLQISNGVGNNMFAPDKEITRLEMLSLI